MTLGAYIIKFNRFQLNHDLIHEPELISSFFNESHSGTIYQY